MKWKEHVLVKEDEKWYALHHGKKLYSRGGYLATLMMYHQLCIEQENESPHRYFPKDFMINGDEVFVDIGAAEGIISLDVVDKVKKVYLLECDCAWKEALVTTFNPWKEKVSIISKYASDICDEYNTTLDALLQDCTAPIIIKIDVEGMERKVLDGAKNLLKRNNVRFLVATYHKKNDAIEFEMLFRKQGYQISFSDGYVLLYGISWKKNDFLKILNHFQYYMDMPL